MKIKEMFEGRNAIYGLVKEVIEKEARNGNSYVTVTLSDGSGEIKANFWNMTKDSFPACNGDVVYAVVDAAPYQGSMGYTIKNVRPVNESDNIDISDFVACAPVKPNVLYDICMNEIDEMRDREIARLVRKLYEDNRDVLIRSSAAKSVHHNIIGGLLWHVYRMVQSAKGICSTYENINADMVIAGILLHDIGKIKELDTDPLGVTSYTSDGVLFGHLFIGAEMIRNTGSKLGITPEKIDALTHIILSHHGKQEWGAVVLPATPEAYIVHIVDLLDSHIYTYEKVTQELAPGESSDRVAVLNGAVIHKF